MFQFQFNPFAIPTLFTAILLILIGIIVFLKSQQKLLKTTFTLFCSTLIVWLLAFTAMYLSQNKNTALNWARIGAIGVLFIPVLAYHFILTFIESAKRLLLIPLYIISLSALFLTQTRYIYKDVALYFWGYYPVAGKFYFIFTIMFFGLFTRDVVLLFKAMQNYKKTNNTVKLQQTKYLLFAFICAIPATIDYIIKYEIEIYPYGYISTLIFMSIISYAILKHNLLNINIIFRKTLIYSIIIGFLFIISALFLYITAQFFGEVFLQRNYWLTLYLVAILAFLFQSIYKRTTGFVDKLFYKGSLPKVAEELQQAEKLAVLASGLAHDIKNPLAPIKTYIQNLPNNLNNPSFIDKITKVIPEEVDKITDTINQLRDFAQPPPLNISKINMHNLIDKRLSLLEHDFTSRNISIEKQYSPAVPSVDADPSQLERVFLNLFLNAIDAMPTGGKLTISTSNSNDSIQIKVSDTGTGIPKEDLPHIFDPFYSKGKQKGTGLGLAVCYRIIKNHSGSIHSESIPGIITTFTVHLPVINK